MFDGGCLDFVQQVVDRLVAGRRHADALAAVQQVDDELRPGPRLARPGWALDEQARLVEAVEDPAKLVDVRRAVQQRRTGGQPGDARPCGAQQVAQRAEAPRTSETMLGDVRGEAAQRRALLGRAVGAARHQRTRQRLVVTLDGAAQLQHARGVIDRHDVDALLGRRVENLVAGLELVLLLGKAQRVDVGLLVGDRGAGEVRLQPADRLAVLDELLG